MDISEMEWLLSLGATLRRGLLRSFMTIRGSGGLLGESGALSRLIPLRFGTSLLIVRRKSLSPSKSQRRRQLSAVNDRGNQIKCLFIYQTLF